MRIPARGLRLLAVTGWMMAASCTALREIPPAQYAAQPERQHVIVDTREGLHYRFDYARFGSDSLVGYRRRDTEGAFDEYDALPIALDDVARLTTRRVDWYRTGLIAGGGLAAVVAVALAQHASQGSTSPVKPCPEEPCP